MGTILKVYGTLESIQKGYKYGIINERVQGITGELPLDDTKLDNVLEDIDIVYLTGLDASISIDKEYNLKRILRDKLRICVDKYEEYTEIELVNNESSIVISVINIAEGSSNNWGATSQSIKILIREVLQNRESRAYGTIYTGEEDVMYDY